MLEDDNLIEHLTKEQYLRMQLLNIDEVILDDEITRKTLASLPPSYSTFQTSLMLSMRGNPNPLGFKSKYLFYLRKSSKQKNMSVSMSMNDSALVMHTKGKNVKHTSHDANKSENASMSKEPQGKHKNKGKYHYCDKFRHRINECQKRLAKEKREEKSKESCNQVSSTYSSSNASHDPNMVSLMYGHF